MVSNDLNIKQAKNLTDNRSYLPNNISETLDTAYGSQNPSIVANNNTTIKDEYSLKISSSQHMIHYVDENYSLDQFKNLVKNKPDYFLNIKSKRELLNISIKKGYSKLTNNLLNHNPTNILYKYKYKGLIDTIVKYNDVDTLKKIIAATKVDSKYHYDFLVFLKSYFVEKNIDLKDFIVNESSEHNLRNI